MSGSLNIGIAGLGTVGGGVVSIITESAALLEKDAVGRLLLMLFLHVTDPKPGIS